VKTQRVVCRIVRHIEKVLTPGNEVKTTQVMAKFDFGENSLGIGIVRMVVNLKVKQCTHESVPELAAVPALAHAP
jgi:hypothetical protein